MSIPVIVQGLGPIGLRITRTVQADSAFDLVGAVDIDPTFIGQEIASLVEGSPARFVVQRTLDDALAASGVSDIVVLHATGSALEMVAPQLEAALTSGCHVVSTCEELSYPFARHPELSAKLDASARAADRTLVATGVNPGFLMDQLVVTLTAASHDIRSVEVHRIQDPRPRRGPFQRKVGVGLSRAEYDRLAATGQFGHVGLEESGRLVAAGLGWSIHNWRTRLEPVQPDPNGPVLGTLQVLDGSTAAGHTIHLHFEAQSEVEESIDEIVVEGTPPLRLRFSGGVFGDEATVAAVLRTARVIPSAPRGLITVLDLPLRARPEHE